MAHLVCSLEEANAVVSTELFPYLIVPAGLCDATDMFWVVTNHSELRREFEAIQAASYTGKAVVISKAGQGVFWQKFRSPVVASEC